MRNQNTRSSAITQPRTRRGAASLSLLAAAACLLSPLFASPTRAANQLNVVRNFSESIGFVKFRGLYGFHVIREGRRARVVLILGWMKAQVGGRTVYQTPQGLRLVDVRQNPQRIRVNARFASQPPFHFHIKADVIPRRRIGRDVISRVHVKLEAQAESFMGRRLGRFTLAEFHQDVKHPQLADTYIDPPNYSQPKKELFVTRTGSFKKIGRRIWRESNGNRFEQVSRTRSYVELYDSRRRIFVRLYGRYAAWSPRSPKRFRKWPGSEGRWSR